MGDLIEGTDLWQFFDALVREQHARLVLAALRMKLALAHEAFDEHDISNLLEDIESPVPLDDACGTLRRVGLMGGSGDGTLVLGRQSFAWPDVRVLLGPASNATVDPAMLSDVLRRSGAWSRTIASRCEALGLEGVPQFWSASENDDHGFQPLVPDPGSMATADLLSLWALVGTGPSGEIPDDVARLARLLVDRVDQGGVLISDLFDDDFVFNFDSERGAHPTLDSAGNVCSALAALAGCSLDFDLAIAVRAALGRLVTFLARMQNEDGSWSIYRDPDAIVNYPAREMSIRFAVLGLDDALNSGALKSVDATIASLALDRTAAFLGRTFNSSESGWSNSFRTDSADDLRQTTAVLLEPAARLSESLSSDFVVEVARALTTAHEARWPDLFRIEFRVPTWSGPSGDKLSWELPASGIVLGGLMRCPRAAWTPGVTGSLARSITDTGRDGYWHDILMAKSGAARASVSNTWLQARALMSWRRQTISDLSL